MSTAGKKIFITAGEISGDLNASHLVRAIRSMDASCRFVGIGGRHLREAGVQLLADSTTWGSVGFFEAVAKTPKVYPVLRRMKRIFAAESPDIYIPVDYRFFSMKAARVAHDMGIPVVYYFAPVNWFGSGGKRFAQLAETVDLSLLALPLSQDDYKAAGARCEFVGHPLADVARPSMTREQAHAHFGTAPGKPFVGLMPGSRVQEIKRLMPVFARACGLITEKIPDVQFVLFSASETLEPLINKYLKGLPVKIARDGVYDFMNTADVLVVCSGTATHEAALMKAPMVVCYKLSPVTAWVARRTINPPMIALPNILAGEFIAPELVQEACTPDAVAGKVLEMLSSEDIRVRMKAALGGVAVKLGGAGSLERAARFVIDELEKGAAAGTLRKNKVECETT